MRKILYFLFVACGLAFAQQAVLLNPFTGEFTVSLKTYDYVGLLATIPATCTQGHLAFITNATAGQQIYMCSATDTWTQQLNSGAGGASIALDNLVAVSINTALLFQSAKDIGSTTKPARDLYLADVTAYGTNYARLTGTFTGARVLTLPNATDTLVGKATTDTLTNKTLTAPVISSIVNTGTLTLPTATGTIAEVAGTSGQIPYNNGSGAYGADSGLAYNSSTKALGVIGTITSGQGGTAQGKLTLNGATSGSDSLSIDATSTLWTFGLPVTTPACVDCGVNITLANEAGTGTTTNKLVKATTAAPTTGIITASTDTTGIIGVCHSGCGTTGSAVIWQSGKHITVVDGGGSVAGHWAVQSTATAGDTMDSGVASTSAAPAGAVGIYLQTLGGLSTVLTDLVNNQATVAGMGGGTVTSAVIAGTANQITAGGTCTITTTGTCTLSLPATVALTGGLTTGSTPPSLTAGTGGADAYGEGTIPSVCKAATVDCVYADSTQHGLLASFNNGTYLPLVQGPASWTTAHVVSSNGTNGGLVADSGVVAANLVVAASPGAGIAHFAGSTQTVTSSAVSLTADVSGVLPTANIAVALANQTSIHGITAGTAAGDSTLGQVIAHGATALDFASTSTGACATLITATATGAASTDVVIFNANASIKAVTGYVPASTGGFSIAAFPTTNTVSFEGCNWTSGTVDPGSITVNWVVVR